MNKIIVIGPSSTHVSRFIDLTANLFNEVIYIGEAVLENDKIRKSHLINFRSKNPFQLIKNSKKLRQIILDEKADVIHIHQVNRVAFFAAQILTKLKIKYVVTAWGSDVLVIPKKNPIYKKMTQKVLSGAACVTADSTDMIEAIKKLATVKKLELIFFGVDSIPFTTKEKIVYSNRALYKLYNIDLVIDEFNEFVSKNNDWKLVIAGTGDELEKLKAKVKNLAIENKVDFVGWLTKEENYRYYQTATIYISLPSSDGTSVSLLEAMSAGCIPVLSNLPVTYEWIKNQENGIIKSPKINALSLATQLDLIKVQKLNSDIINARASGEITTAGFKSIYQNLS